MNDVIERPVFLVGAERSGTTLLRLMLDAHPDIVWQSEFEFAVDCIGDNGQWPILEEYYLWLKKNRVFLDTKFSIDNSLDYPALVKSFLMQKLGERPGKIVGATCHRHYEKLRLIWPDARFIHIVRDPRDVAKSNIGMGWAGNVWYGVDRWLEAEKSWNKLSRELNDSMKMEICYEDLICSPEPVLRNLSQFLGVGYSDEMMSYSNTSTYSQPDESLVFQWKQKQSPRQIQLVELKVGNALVDKGYEMSQFPAIKVSSYEKNKLYLQNAFVRRRDRIKKFGFFLVTCNYFARALKLESLEMWTLDKIFQIERMSLK